MHKIWKNSSSYTIALFLVIFALCSCRTTDNGSNEPKTPVWTEHDDSTVLEGKAMAENYMDSFIAAVQKNNFDLLMTVLSENSSKRLDRAKFIDMQKWISSKLGRLDSGKYIDCYRQGALCSYIWKLSFVKDNSGEASAGDSKENIPQKAPVELAYSVNVMMIDGVPKIVQTGFVFW